MKNCFVLLCILLLAGCTEADVDTTGQPKIGAQKFCAAFAEEDTRTFVDEKVRLLWTEGDLLTIFTTTLNKKYQFDGVTGDNSGTFSEVPTSQFGTGNPVSANYAVYPYSTSNKLSNDEVLTLSLPATQKYAENTFGQDANTMVAVTSGSNDYFLPFKNVGGFLRLRLYGKFVKVKSIELRGNNHEKIAGKATVVAKYGQSPVLEMNGNATETITLDCGEGVTLGATEAEAKDFWIVVPPTTFTNGFTVTITDTAGATMEKSTTKSYTVERNVLKSMTAFEVKTAGTPIPPDNEIWYVMSDETVYDVYQTTESYRHQPFDANVVSNTYQNGYGIITFDAPVTRINDYTFGNGWARNMTELYLPDCIEYLGNSAISDTGLSTLRIPKNLKQIDSYSYCLHDNQNLESFSGEQVSEDGKCVIIDGILCGFAPKGLKEYTIPEGVKTIGWYVFGECEIENIHFPESLESIGRRAFYDCRHLKSVTLPSSLKTLVSDAFESCISIEGFYGNPAFHTEDNKCLISQGNDGLRLERFAGLGLSEYTIPDGIVRIEDSAFEFKTDLIRVTIPSSVVYVHGRAFYECSNIEAIDGPNVSEDHRAFVYNHTFGPLIARKNFPSAYHIPDNVTRIGDWALAYYPGITNITMGDQITHIENQAFGMCPNLKSITLSAGLKEMDFDVFWCSNHIETIYCRALVPPSISDLCLYSDNLTIYVPEESLSLYQNSADWAPYKDYLAGYKYTDLPE